MVSCSTFVTELECALHYQNEFNVKLILLIALLGFIVFSIWYSRDIDFSESLGDLFKFISFSIFPKALLIFYPFFLFTLKNSVTLELVINTITIFYFIVLTLSIGVILFYGKDKVLNIMDRRDNKFKYIGKQ